MSGGGKTLPGSFNGGKMNTNDLEFSTSCRCKIYVTGQHASGKTMLTETVSDHCKEEQVIEFKEIDKASQGKSSVFKILRRIAKLNGYVPFSVSAINPDRERRFKKLIFHKKHLVGRQCRRFYDIRSSRG